MLSRLHWPKNFPRRVNVALSRILILILLLRAGIHPNPGPPNPTPPPQTFLQWNCNGLTSAAERLSHFLHLHNVKVAAIQETKLQPRNKDPRIPGYSILRRDRPGGGRGGGVALLFHHSVAFTPVDINFVDPHLEAIAASVSINNSNYNVANIYCPPSSACPSNYIPNFDAVLDLAQGDSLILGDWNAHHGAWFSPSEDDRGEALAEAIENSDLCVLNLDQPTRLPLGAGNNQRPTSPDVSLISAHLALAVTWSAHVHLASDHLPITIAFNDDVPNPRLARSFINFKRADWPKFKDEAETLVSQLRPPTTCGSGEKLLRNAINTAAKHNIPAGYRKEYVPGRTAEVVDLQSRYDALRTLNPQDPALADIEIEIKRVSAAASRSKWQDFVESQNRRSNPRHYWQMLRSLSGARSFTSPNQYIKFGQKSFSKPAAIAKQFNKQYTNLRKHSSNKESRKVNKDLKTSHPLDHSFKPFTLEDTAEAIKRSKYSTALGPDGIAAVHLKHLGPIALAYLTELFNISVANADVPAIWKNALVLPVLKPGKPTGEGPSYRPISLLCPASKILERLLLPYLNEHLVCDDSQHGFRKGRSPISALLPLSQTIADGFNEKKPAKRTVVVAIDISKAFETISHDRLLKKLSDSPLPHNLVRWFSAFIRGREQSVIFNGAQSPFKHVHLGVPQGAVTSPTLFNYFVSDFPSLHCDKTSFADDFSVFASDSDINVAVSKLNSDLSLISEWARDLDLKIAPSKSSVTLFTPNTHEHNFHPQVRIEEPVDLGGVFGTILLGEVLPLAPQPKILSVTLDTHFTFSPHAREVAKSCTQRLKVLKALAGTNWGQDKETLLITYKALVRSKIDYAAPVWVPNVKKSPIKRLQAIQNAGLRIVSGCVKMSAEEHLHTEAKMLSVSDHLQLLAAQFLASTLRPTHPLHSIITSPAGPRDMKGTLLSVFRDDVSPYLTNGVIPTPNYNDVKNRLHANYVRRAIDSRLNRNILSRATPPVNSSDRRLPRAHRSALAQLRSGHCSALNAYLARVGRADSPACPQCGADEHSPLHLFSCPSHPTDLRPIDLWLRPSRVATFISSLPPFSHLPPPAPPPLAPEPPRPPPEPPPS